MSSLKGLSVVLAGIAIGCGARPLDPHDASGTGGVGVLDGGSGGVITEGGVLDGSARPDVHPDMIVVDPQPGVYCGNGVLDPGEQCDDGNHNPGDGCTALCQIPCNWICGSCGTPTPCITTRVCGDGVLAVSEVCDDGNVEGSDGCAANCAAIETGWRCPIPGHRCSPICGDLLIVGPESCDDGNTSAGDGCSDICLIEPSTASCGNGLMEGAEQCDDGPVNGTYYGACTPSCRFGAYCGDGVVNGLEQCDLGAGQNVTTYGNMVGCGTRCEYPHYCGDGVVDENEGEQCDFGPDNGQSGAPCSSACKVLVF
jgi:cysteine-rich repeat protein